MSGSGKGPRFDVRSTQPGGGGSVLDELTGAPTGPPIRSPRAAPRETRTPIRVLIPEALADRVRGAVAALQYREPGWSSLNAAAAAALENFVTEAEQAHNGGRPFPWRAGRQLQPGRRMGQ